MRRTLLLSLAGFGALGALAVQGLALAQDDTPPEGTAPLVVVPSGCTTPDPAQAVFIGTLVDKVPDMARFSLDQLRAGSLTAFEIAGFVDVSYDDETKFLDEGETYLIGTVVDPETGRLFSKVREPAPLFGGNDVIGVDDSDVQCPEVGDPARTLLPDGTSVESGVFSPLGDSRWRLIRAIAIPVGVAFGAVMALAIVKTALFGVARGFGVLAARALGEEPPPRKPRRRHGEAL